MYFVPSGNPNAVPNLKFASFGHDISGTAAGFGIILPSLSATSMQQYQIWGVFVEYMLFVNAASVSQNSAIIVQEHLAANPFAQLSLVYPSAGTQTTISMSVFVPVPGYITTKQIDLTWPSTDASTFGNAFGNVYYTVL